MLPGIFVNLPQDPAKYAQSAIVAEEVCNEMLARLTLMTIKPQVIAVMGSRVGYEARKLQELYPDASIISLDQDPVFLEFASSPNSLCVELDALPLPSQSIDFIFANLTLSFTPKNLLKEWQRILRPEGLLMFSFFGTQSFVDWPAQVQDSLICHVSDMHNLGDELVKHKLADPVLDADYLTLKYKQLETLHHELSSTFILPATISSDVLALIPLVVQFEIIYGHAWRGVEQVEQGIDEEGVVKFPLNYLRQRS